EYSGSAGAGLTGISVASLVQSIFDAKEKAAEPATTVNVRRSREASRDLSSYPLGLSARIAADLGVDNSAPQPHQVKITI
ncbi:hypothetical protein T492DRAFT_866593, partial [Pavlovales sp. CCMP2436]